MPDELKPCPFCEEVELVRMNASRTKDVFYVSCAHGLVAGPVDRNEQVAVEKWNCRPLEDAQAARICKLEAQAKLLQRDLRKAQQDRVALRGELDAAEGVLKAVKWWRAAIQIKERGERARATKFLAGVFDIWKGDGGGG